MTTKEQLVIREIGSGTVLAKANVGQYQQIEGNWYIDPAAVDQSHLRISAHDYHCPYKGRCLYVDFDAPGRTVQRVAWVYNDVKPGWEHINGKFAFYAGSAAQKIGKTKDTLE